MVGIGPTMVVCSLSAQVGIVCIATLLCMSAATDLTMEATLQQVTQQTSLDCSIPVDLHGFF